MTLQSTIIQRPADKRTQRRREGVERPRHTARTREIHRAIAEHGAEYLKLSSRNRLLSGGRNSGEGHFRTKLHFARDS
jgi:hypothetical protein